MTSNEDRSEAIYAADRAREEYGDGSPEHRAAEAELERVHDAYMEDLANEPDWDEMDDDDEASR